MTLILTALYRDGICVCADKSNKRVSQNGLIENIDQINKIYRLTNTILIYNHGVNSFNDMSWRDLCAEYKKLDQWKSKTVFEIRSEFEKFVIDKVTKQLEKNYNSGLKGAIGTGFVFCGKTVYDTNFKIYELFWLYNSSLIPQHSSLDGEGLIKSGDSKKYLQDYLNRNSRFTKPRYWKDLEASECKENLVDLFSIALKEQKRQGNDDFSSNFDIECVSE